MSDTKYRFTVRSLTEDEGGGYLIEFPNLPVACRTARRSRKPSPTAKTPDAAGSPL
jgi:hypothetical protein